MPRISSRNRNRTCARPYCSASGKPRPVGVRRGEKATTWVSQTGEDSVVEHGLSYYAATKSMRLTPGHNSAADTVYRMFDPVGTALRCFRCHSTGPVSLVEGKIEPAEAGIRCEACHGPGAAHVRAGGSARSIQNPKRLNAGATQSALRRMSSPGERP